MAGLYERHDRDKFEIVALDAGVNDGSDDARRGWKMPSTAGSTSQACPTRRPPQRHPRTPEIDILVNLNGYFGEARMGVFAQRPAPLQVNYLGFPATLGAPYIDYIIADEIVIPEDEQALL